MTSFLLKALVIFLALDFFVAGMYIIFLFNLNISVKRRIEKTRFYIAVIEASRSEETSAEAGKLVGLSEEAFREYCEKNDIWTPEHRKEVKAEQEKKKREERDAILEEEATWRAEQERLTAERRRLQEEEARKRKDRLKKFGFK